MKRVLNARETFTPVVTEPIASNYYPITTAIFINDEQAQLSILTDRCACEC